MRTSALFHFSLLLFAFPLFAAPAKNAAEPVAEGYPAWTGVTPKNYIAGRVLGSNADLRQRVATVVVEFDAAKTAEQLEKTGGLSKLNGLSSVSGHGSTNWESVEIPRDILVVYVAKNAKAHEAVAEGMKAKDATKNPGLSALNAGRAPVYAGITFEGAPENGGKLPFVYVMGYEGKEALLKEEFGAKTESAVSKVIAAQKKKMAEADLKWRPFYGYVSEPKHFHDIEKTLAKGKPPFDAVEAKLVKSVKAGDAEKAKEAQLLYDGLEQTRSDMMFMAQCSIASSPHVAAYKMNQVLKYWPKSKKAMSEIAEKIKANSGAQPFIKMYAKIVEWSDPNFTCKNAGEAKKIVDELNKMKKMLEPMKEDKNIRIQNSALTLDGMLDELISVIPAKVPQK